MGLFDNVKFSTTCPNCGEEVSGFQSKSGECLGRTLEFWQVTNFYATCTICRTWIEYNLKDNRPRAIEDYDVSIEQLPLPLAGT